MFYRDKNQDIWIGINASIMFVDNDWFIDKKEDKKLIEDTNIDKEQEN